MQASRRDFTRWAGAAAIAALTWRGSPALAAAAADGAAPTIDQRLAPIAPELRPFARRMLESGFPPITAETLRKMPANSGPPPQDLMPAVPVIERDVPATGSLPGVKVYVVNSDPSRRRPAILHTHGGGFILGSARGELRNLQETAQTLDCVVVTVEYQLSPKVRYTQSTEETYAGLKWLHDNGESLGVDRSRIAVMGESAGGGHAAILAIKARDRGEVPLVFQSLVYPMLDDRTGSVGKVPPFVATVGWSAGENRLGWESFLGVEPGGPNIPAAAVPARLEDVSGLPPAWIGVGGVDLFAAEDITYARRLTLANVPTELLVMPGGFHGFDRVAASTSLAREFTQSKLSALRRVFSKQRS